MYISPKILDTHLGSGSNRISAHKNGFDFTGFEIDKDYYEAQERRFSDYLKQPVLQFEKEIIIQQQLKL